ncbi:MAG: ABC transporter permease [Treponema sp.]|jgi:sulfonate transport system permease protein|nr:ABC transporter permease [Treponema sp.]
MLPGPAEIAAAAFSLAREGILVPSLLASLGRVVCGLGLGIALGVPLGLVSGASRIVELVFDRPVQILRAIPFNALAPLLIILLGVGETMKISLIVIGVFVPLYLNTRSGVLHFDTKLLELSRAYRMPWPVVAWHILLKGVLPSILTGLRFVCAIAWIALVTCETVNAKSGIGYMLSRAQTFARMDEEMVCILLYAIMGLTTDAFVRLLEKTATRWKRKGELH